MRVWVGTPSHLRAAALAALLDELGFEAVLDGDIERCDAAVLDLLGARPPYPSPPDVPTLLVTDAPEASVFALLRGGFRGRLGARDGRRTLSEALRAVARGEIWLEPGARSRFVDHLRREPRPIN